MALVPGLPRKVARKAPASVDPRASGANVTVVVMVIAGGQVVPPVPEVLVGLADDVPAAAVIRRDGRFVPSVSTISGTWTTRTSLGSGDTLANAARSSLDGSLVRALATSDH